MAHAENISVEVKGHPLFTGVNFSIYSGDRIGLVGRNGIGKTTLLRVLSGHLPPTHGAFILAEETVGILPQDLSTWLNHTVGSFIESVTGIAGARKDFEGSCQALATDSSAASMRRYTAALEQYERLAVSDYEHRLMQALAQAQIAEIDVSQEIGRLSGGQKTRVALAALFASNYDIVLLDEPTNSLDAPGVVLLEKYIGSSEASFVIVSHDRRFLRNTTTRIIELIGGPEGVRQYNLGYDEYTAARQRERDSTIKHHNQYEEERRRLKDAAREANIRASSASGNRRAADGDKLTANYRKQRAARSLGASGASIASRLDMLEEPARPEQEISLALNFGKEHQKRSTLLTVGDLRVEIPGSERTVGPLSLHVQNGDTVIISGENGAGKTTLLKAVVGDHPVHSGAVNFGREARLVYMDQNQTPPLPSSSALDNLRHVAPELELHNAIRLLLRFGLKKDIVHAVRANELSGGERAKLLLAAIAAKQANLLILDEPTNNLDIPTIEALEEALHSFTGSIVMVSHDRDFINALKPDSEIML